MKEQVEGYPDYRKRKVKKDAIIAIIEKSLVSLNSAELSLLEKSDPEKAKFYRSRLKPKELKRAIDYLRSLEDLDFICDSPPDDLMNWEENDFNIEITDFATSYLSSDDWNSYMLLVKHIPLMRVGSASYKIEIDGETILFRLSTQKRLWTWKNKYRGHVELWKTHLGNDKAPILVVVSDYDGRFREDGLYLIIPKSF